MKNYFKQKTHFFQLLITVSIFFGLQITHLAKCPKLPPLRTHYIKVLAAQEKKVWEYITNKSGDIKNTKITKTQCTQIIDNTEELVDIYIEHRLRACPDHTIPKNLISLSHEVLDTIGVDPTRIRLKDAVQGFGVYGKNLFIDTTPRPVNQLKFILAHEATHLLNQDLEHINLLFYLLKKNSVDKNTTCHLVNTLSRFTEARADTMAMLADTTYQKGAIDFFQSTKKKYMKDTRMPAFTTEDHLDLFSRLVHAKTLGLGIKLKTIDGLMQFDTEERRPFPYPVLPSFFTETYGNRNNYFGIQP